MVSSMLWGSVYFHYRKIVVDKILNTPLASSVVLKGSQDLFKKPGYDSCGNQHNRLD